MKNGNGKSTPSAPQRPLTKNGRPALMPLEFPEDLRTLERWAFRHGMGVGLKGGREINPNKETWPVERIDRELPPLGSSTLPVSPPAASPPSPLPTDGVPLPKD
jgi:hypothetical protein